jgi:hypothetical protein
MAVIPRLYSLNLTIISDFVAFGVIPLPFAFVTVTIASLDRAVGFSNAFSATF